MKIVCENCSTKYSIADEKVRGKVFKIRCKKCGHIIVVKGTGMAAAASTPEANAAGQFDDKETRVFDYSGFAESMTTQAVWHLVIDGGQVGPLSAEQVAAKYDAGEIDSETYTWKEGFKDWLRLADIEEFASLTAEEDGKTELMNEGQAADLFSAAGAKSGAAAKPAATTPAPAARPAALTPAPAAKPAASSSGPAAAAGGGLFGGMSAEPASTPAPAASSGGGLFGDVSPAAATDSGGLFGATASASPSGSRGSLFPEEPQADANSPKMTGQRNENSVLFSLSNLQSLATGSAKPAAASSKPGYASAKSEGSGLVDIRAMAATALPKDGSSIDGFSFSAPSLAAPISAAPVLMPVADSGRPKWLIPALAGGGVLLVAVIVLLVVVLMKGDKPSKETGTKVAQTDMAAGDMAAGDMAAGDMAAGDMAAGDMAAGDMAAGDMAAGDMAAGDMAAGDMAAGDMAADDMAADDMAAGDAKAGDAMGAGGRRRPPVAAGGGGGGRRPASGGGGGGETRPRPRPQPADMGMAGGDMGGGSSLQDLLRQAGGGDMGGGGGGGGADLPSRLGPSDIRSGVDRVIGTARACYNRYRVAGTCQVRVVISGSSGRPSSVAVVGTFAGTPTGRCVEQAFQRASFRKFSSASQSFVFPLIFR